MNVLKENMRKLIIFIFLCFSAGITADKLVAPDWMDAISREMLYPADEYYIGFASDKAQKDEDKSVVYDRVQQNARLAAVSSIQVSVEQTVERYIQNTQSYGNVSSTDIMTSLATSHTGIKDIPGLKVETWENPKTGDICAFAWVKITDLSHRLMRRISTNIGKIESELRNVEFLIEKDEKVQAKNNLPSIRTMLEDIENDQRVMLSIDPSVTDEDLSIEDVKILKERYRAFNVALKNGIAIYLECTADMFGMKYTMLESEIRGVLSEMGCEFVTKREQADWAVNVTAPAREYRATKFGSTTTYFTYVDATIVINKISTDQLVFEDLISEQGGHTYNFEQAAREAYKQISPRISAIIKEQIQK